MGSAAAARRQRQRQQQRGDGGSGILAAAWRQLGGGGNGGGGSGGGGQRVNSATPVGMAAVADATTVLPPLAAMVAMKTLMVTAMAGAQTTINNQLKAAEVAGSVSTARHQRAWPW
jgi:hypothetical protein